MTKKPKRPTKIIQIGPKSEKSEALILIMSPWMNRRKFD